MKLSTPVNIAPPKEAFRLSDSIVLLGSCFADNIAGKLSCAGFRICANPFGTLYNPASIRTAVERLDGTALFGPEDCVEMGAGAGRICSFEHHTSFSRPTAEEFLANANAALEEARSFWRTANRVIISLGTAMVWYSSGRAVSNCLKRPASEFCRRMLEISEISDALQSIVDKHPEKRFTITVSPIRHLGDGAHVNSISKARLLVGSDGIADYFPAFEIMTDELRDYRFYADDLVHPAPVAINYIWERFLESFVAPGDLDAIKENEKAARHSAHRSIL